MDWQFDNDRPIYAQLVEQMERAVVNGQWPPGAKVPGVRELAAEAGVNPNTMQRALAALESGGLVYAQRTSGRFVTDDAAKIAALRAQLASTLSQNFVRDMRALGCADGEINTAVDGALAATSAPALQEPISKEETDND